MKTISNSQFQIQNKVCMDARIIAFYPIINPNMIYQHFNTYKRDLVPHMPPVIAYKQYIKMT